MTLLRTANSDSKPNKTLKGHKLVIVSPWPPTDENLAHLRDAFPDLAVELRQGNWGSKIRDLGLSEGDWADTTILFTPGSKGILPQPDEAPKLQYVQLLSAGANTVIDEPLFKDTKVTFCTANGVHGPQISEWIIGTFLAFQHKIPKYLKNQHDAVWKKIDEPVYDTVGQRVGILGYGSIGRQVARVAKAMGMDVHAYTLHPRTTPESRRDDGWAPPGLGDPEGTLPSKWFSGTTRDELDKFLSSGLDLLVVALPLTDLTRGLLSTREFELLSKNRKTFVSNIGRGPIIDTQALQEALEKGKIRGAALDVTDPEPLPDGHPLWSAPNILITPHVSGSSTSYGARCWSILMFNLERLAEGQPLANRVSRRDGY